MLTKSIAAAGLALAAMVLPAEAGILVPDTVDKGERVDVVLSEAVAGARIELWGPVTQGGGGERLMSLAVDGVGTRLTLDQPAGSYELRHIAADGTVLAREAIDVSAGPVVLSVPPSVEATGQFEVTWRGPGQSGDSLQLFDPVAGTVVEQVDATGGERASNTTKLTAPDRAGTFEVRYRTGAGHVLKTQRIAVNGGQDWLRTPLVVGPGETFDIEWKRAAPADMAVRIATPEGVPVGGDAALRKVVDGKTQSTLIAPDKTGDYVIEVFVPETGRIVKSLPLDVDPAG